jgi:hypothetical protein
MEHVTKRLVLCFIHDLCTAAGLLARSAAVTDCQAEVRTHFNVPAMK